MKMHNAPHSWPDLSDHFAAGHGSPGGEWQELPGRCHEAWLRDR